jgi:hypothetical protein
LTSNLAASVRARLLNLARKESADFGLMLNRYGRERLLYRISKSAQKERYVLKGATLFESWTGKAYRPTRDVDLLGFGSSNVADLVHGQPSYETRAYLEAAKKFQGEGD